MAVFKDAAELYQCIGGLFRLGAKHPEMGAKVGASNLIIRFEYSDPDSILTVDAKSPKPEGAGFNVLEGDNALKPDVLMTMSADIAHQFWFGTVNLVQALNRGQMKAKGPIASILRLLPAIKPAYTLYPQHLRDIGRSDLVQ